MKFAQLLFFIMLLSFNFAKAQLPIQERFIAVPLQNLEHLTLAHRPVVLANVGGLALVKLNPNQIDELATKLHEKNHSCGGFTDVQILMEKYGVSPQQALSMNLNHERSMIAFDKTEPTFPNEVKKALTFVDSNRMWKFLAELSSFPNRSAYSAEGVQAAQWLADRATKLAQAHQRTDMQVLTFPTGGSYKQPSIAIRIIGGDSKLPGVLMGGHMDTFDNIKPGSDDDGSGTASVMEVYNAILDSGLKFKRDVYFAFYAAEERGLVGSQAMVAEFKKRGIPMRAILQFDMTGFKSPQDNKEIYMITDHVSAPLTKFVAHMTEFYGIVPTSLIAATKCGYSCSDHASWTNAGYDSAFPFEASFDNYNKTLHTPDDKMNIMNQEHANKFTRIGAAFIVETADPQ